MSTSSQDSESFLNAFTMNTTLKVHSSRLKFKNMNCGCTCPGSSTCSPKNCCIREAWKGKSRSHVVLISSHTISFSAHTRSTLPIPFLLLSICLNPLPLRPPPPTTSLDPLKYNHSEWASHGVALS